MSRTVAEVALVCALISGPLLSVGNRDYPNLHTILDTGIVLLSGVLTWLLWEVGVRLNAPFPRLLAASFGATAATELVHVLVTIEWSGILEPVAQASTVLRPVTWPPAAHLLPLAVAGCLLMPARRPLRLPWFLVALTLISVAMFAAFSALPRYTEPVWFGMTRPALALVPVLSACVAWLAWKARERERIAPPLVWMALFLAASGTCILYSRAPHDTAAMLAHLTRLSGYLVLLMAVAQMGSADMSARVRAEEALSTLNQQLEGRVQERTRQLETAVSDYRQSEQRLHAQLERMNLLDRLTRAIGERQDLDSVLQVVVRSLEDQLPADFCCVCLYDRADKQLTVTRVGPKSQPMAATLGMLETSHIAIDENGLARCVSGQLVYEADVTRIAFPFPQRLATAGLRALVAAPLIVESHVFGVLITARRSAGGFSSGECEFLRQLSEHVALAAHQATLHSALQRAYDDLRQTQQAVLQQERLKALGQMASGIAHDINNAISPVAIYAEWLLESEPDLSERSRDYLSTIQRSAEDVAQTVARMREFYRQREPQLSLLPVDVNKLVTDVVGLTRARWSDMPLQRGIVIRTMTDLGSDLPPVAGVESEIREALINLMFNAVDAMPEGGTLTIQTSLEDTRYRWLSSGQSPRVHLSVSDTGTGMSADTRRRCLEPFFTTKGERGTGLGLAMVYGMVQRHAADIDITSELGQGTTVHLSFAASETTAPAAQAAPAQRVSHLRILVVDDDPLLVKSLRDTLESDAHQVTVAHGGQEGLERLQEASERAEPFAIVITDLGMPHVDGRRVARKVKELFPATPVIMLTGWGQRLIDDGDVPPHVDRVLNKPPRLPELRAAFAELHARRHS